MPSIVEESLRLLQYERITEGMAPRPEMRVSVGDVVSAILVLQQATLVADETGTRAYFHLLQHTLAMLRYTRVDYADFEERIARAIAYAGKNGVALPATVVEALDIAPETLTVEGDAPAPPRAPPKYDYDLHRRILPLLDYLKRALGAAIRYYDEHPDGRDPADAL